MASLGVAPWWRLRLSRTHPGMECHRTGVINSSPSDRSVTSLTASPEEQQRFSKRLRADLVWFALTRRTTLDPGVKKVMERAGQVITVYKKGLLVAACKGSFRTGKLSAVRSKEDWSLWASLAATGGKAGKGGTGGSGADLVQGLKQSADSIHLTRDGVATLDLGCLSSREALLGPAGAAYTRSGIVVGTDGSLRRNGARGHGSHTGGHKRATAGTQRGGFWPAVVNSARIDGDRSCSWRLSW